MKKLTALFLALAMCLSLAACGGSSSGGSGNGGSSDDNVMSLSVSGTESDAYTKAIKDLVEEFNANNEFGVTIEPEFQATSDYKTKLSTTMASDLFTGKTIQKGETLLLSDWGVNILEENSL